MAAPYETQPSLQSPLAAVAASLPGSRLHPLVLMSDPVRTPDLLALAEHIPPRSALIYRHYGAPGLEDRLREITARRGVQLLVGNDPDLAVQCGADGVHFSRRADTAVIDRWREAWPDWVLSAAATKDPYPSVFPNALDALFVSPVFASRSPSAGTPLGLPALKDLTARLSGPVFALGGIDGTNVRSLQSTGIAGIASIGGLAQDLRTAMKAPAPNADPIVANPETSAPGTVTIAKEEDGQMIRFTADVAGSSATGELTLRRVADEVWNANHTGVPSEIGGRGVGKALVAAMVEDARAQGYRVVPGCPFVAKLFERKPDWAEGVAA